MNDLQINHETSKIIAPWNTNLYLFLIILVELWIKLFILKLVLTYSKRNESKNYSTYGKFFRATSK